MYLMSQAGKPGGVHPLQNKPSRFPPTWRLAFVTDDDSVERNQQPLLLTSIEWALCAQRCHFINALAACQARELSSTHYSRWSLTLLKKTAFPLTGLIFNYFGWIATIPTKTLVSRWWPEHAAGSNGLRDTSSILRITGHNKKQWII